MVVWEKCAKGQRPSLISKFVQKYKNTIKFGRTFGSFTQIICPYSLYTIIIRTGKFCEDNTNISEGLQDLQVQ